MSMAPDLEPGDLRRRAIRRERTRAELLERRIRRGCCTVDVRGELARTLARIARLEARP
jgi:hypothetical protein